MKYVICPNCKAENPGNNTVCSYCYSSLNGVERFERDAQTISSNTVFRFQTFSQFLKLIVEKIKSKHPLIGIGLVLIALCVWVFPYILLTKYWILTSFVSLFFLYFALYSLFYSYQGVIIRVTASPFLFWLKLTAVFIMRIIERIFHNDYLFAGSLSNWPDEYNLATGREAIFSGIIWFIWFLLFCLAGVGFVYLVISAEKAW